MRYISAALLVLISFLVGALFHKFKPFPYTELYGYYRSVNINDEKQMKKYDLYSAEEVKKISFNLEKTQKNFKEVREYLIKRVLNEDTVVNTIIYNDKNKIIFSRNYGVLTKNILTKPNNKKSECLNIYIHGHDESPFKFDYYKSFLRTSIKLQCDTLTMSPVAFGLNEGESSFPGYKYYIKLNKKESQNHFFYSYYNGNLDPLSLFLSNHYYVINNISGQYSRISITGISGGGWYATWLSALLPQIDLSIIYAGSMPIKYHYSNISGDFPVGDWEQTGSKIYNEYDYWDLFKLSMLDNSGKNNRKSYLVYNSNDPCCFREPFVSNMKSIFSEFPVKMPFIIIDRNSEHEINNHLIKKLFNENSWP